MSAFLLQTSFLPAKVSVTAIPTSIIAEPIQSSSSLLAAQWMDTHGSTAAISAVENVATSSSFEAIPPDAAILVGMGSVLLLCIVAGYVWANDVVPVSRSKLAISKSRGEVREYLDGLRQSEGNIGLNNRSKFPSASSGNEIDSVTSKVRDGRDFERWLFSDWLNKPNIKGGRQKEPALPILREAKWNSGDNPVLVTAAMMVLGVVLAAITERFAI